MTNLFPLGGWWRMVESIAAGPTKRKQRTLARKQRLKGDPLNLAWWSMWWLRMERVASMEEKSSKQERNRQAAASNLRKFLNHTCMTPDKKERIGNHLCTAQPESTEKGSF